MPSGGGRLALAGLRKDYGVGEPAVDRLDLEIGQGEFVALLGPSGCGKTTTLRMIAGLVEPTAGRILLDGDDLTAKPVHRRNIGMVFQNYALFPHMSVADNIAFGLEMRGIAGADIRGRVAEALALVRLSGFEARRPKALSGGQQQRVALARALVIRPDLLLLDEPLSNLDAKLREEMRGEIREIQRRLGITTVFVTHDQTEALALADRVAVMERGRLAQLGTPEDVYERPATPFVARFVGRINALAAAAGGDGRLRIAGAAIPVADLLPVGARATVMVRPQHIALTPSGGALSGRITGLTYVGDVVQIAVAGDGFAVVAERGTADPGWRGLGPGQDVGVAWPATAALVFPENANGR
ncbi:MAG: ABC transporter ATP-binding protein [Alphaproteobacteria bacterium]|nr:ABC transporter ATP-binding protein [Alphaproteobacteria bacterium]